MAQPFRCGTLEVPAKPQQRGTTVDHATTLRSAYERINAGDIDGFGELLAPEFVEHE
jgi:hypothetical protein